MFEGLNSIDEKIIKILKNDSRKSFVEIANEIGMSESAVRRRVKNLQDIGVIKKFTIDMGHSNKTSAITGQYDIATVINAPTILEINSYIDEIRKIDGVSDTNTVIILRTLSNSN